MRWREAGRNRSKVIGTKADARLFDADLTRRARMGELSALDSGKVTLGIFAEETWWPMFVRPNLARQTRESYAGVWDRHIGPALGGYPLREITAPLVRSFLADLRERGVGPQSVRRAKAVLQSALSRAVEQGLIHGNPAAAVRLPKSESKASVQAIGPTDIERLRGVLSARDATLVSVLSYVGLRPGEALGPRWGDIGERTVLIERSDDDGTIKSTKTGRRRTARLLAPVRADLQAWRMASGRPDDDHPVFPKRTGGAWRTHDWQNWRRMKFVPAAKALGIDIRRPYDLRHAAASLALHEGRSVVEVAAWLGHSPTMALGTYAHVIDELRDSPQIPAEEAIRRAREKSVPAQYPSEAADA